MIILGIDPGYERLGIAVVEKTTQNKDILLFSECFKTSAQIPFNKRLFLLGQEIDRVCIAYTPQVLSIETLLFNSNQKTALMVSEARGVVIYEARRHNLEVCEYTPLQIKNAITGYGRATKDQVDSMTRQLISLPDTLSQDDEMDAIATALTCSASYRNETIR
jgi:crossover junction endodeoxyribonuclease RuvC